MLRETYSEDYKMLRKIVVLLVRKKLKLKKNEEFQFIGQKSNAVYFFTQDAVMKYWHKKMMQSGVSLNRLLNDECKIRKVNKHSGGAGTPTGASNQ